MKQYALFAPPKDDKEELYTSLIPKPVYEPRGIQPHLGQLVDLSKVNRLIREIEASELPEDVKAFLKVAAYRHAVFNYENIADYYANTDAATQKLMEASALVIIDFNDAIARGFVKISKAITQQYLTEYPDDTL